MKPTEIYLKMMREVVDRLVGCETYIAAYEAESHIYDLESAALQLRKAMEAVAFASIAPNEKLYAEFRQNASKPAFHGNDWNASLILLALEKVNRDFYPKPLGNPVKDHENVWAFQQVRDGFMTRDQFDRVYSKLGKFLHADNPWGNPKGWEQIAAGMTGSIVELRGLINHHAALIQSPDFCGTWIVEVPNDGSPPRMLMGQAEGPFTAQ